MLNERVKKTPRLWLSIGLLLVPCLFLIMSFQNCSDASFSKLANERGEDSFASSRSDFTGNDVTEKYLRELEPSMAVRAPACVTCHAKLSSNFITDFGYGDPYFFGGAISNPSISWKVGAVYGDHQNSLSTLALEQKAQVIIPKAMLPAQAQADTGLRSVEDYVISRLNPNQPSVVTDARVATKSKITIAAPTESQILKAFNVPSLAGPITYIGSDGTRRQGVRGLEVSYSGDYVQNNGEIECEGDVLINSILYLDRPSIRTTTGCRLYVTKSVFFYGPLNLSGTSVHKNLQITSSRSINLGLGETKVADNYCAPNSWYMANSGHPASSLIVRHRAIWTHSSHFTRGSASPQELGEAIISDAEKVGNLLDAECRPETRSVGFERILLNAPEVHSRYQGLFRGTIITEFALISLGSFVFEFDPVFSAVPILPMLIDLVILEVNE